MATIKETKGRIVMKANELMIGDWVLYNKQPHQVRQLGIYGTNRDGDDYPAICVGKPNGIGLILERNEIKPILLTAEILEKNLATEPQIVWCVGWNKKNDIHVEINREYLNASFYGVIDFVHQLQHALRLCGISKEIEL